MRADNKLFARIAKVRNDLKALEDDLTQHGDRELAKAVKRAHRELDHPAVTGAENTRGVKAGAVRR